MRAVTLLCLLLTLSNTAVAQSRLRIAVIIESDSNDTVVESAVRRELRKFTDIEIVAEDDVPDMVIDGMVMCVGACANTSGYFVALALELPMPRSWVQVAIKSAALTATRAQVDTLMTYLGHFRRVYLETTHYIPRGGVEVAVARYIASIDTGCFEKLRLLRRPIPPTDAELRVMNAKEWAC